MKIVSIDIETTGLNIDNCCIIEFGAVSDDLRDPIPVECLPVYHCYFIQPNYNGEPFALSMHAKIFRRIADREEGYNYYSPTKFGNGFKLWLIENGYEAAKDKVTITVAGKNFGSFDLQYLERQTDIAKHVRIRHKIIDPAILYLNSDDEVLPGLAECKQRAGMGNDVAHNAVDDAKDVVHLVRKKLLNKFK